MCGTATVLINAAATIDAAFTLGALMATLALKLVNSFVTSESSPFIPSVAFSKY